jgi:hypothetical protein
MTRRRPRGFLPRRLTMLAPSRLRWVRPLWFLALAFAVVLDIAGTVFAVREVTRIEPQFARLSLSSEVELDGSVTVSTIEGLRGVPAIVPLSRITAIDGKPVARGVPSWELASRLKAPDGRVVALAIAAPNGRVTTHRIAAGDYPAHVSQAAPFDRATRLSIRLVLSLLTCVTLIGCAVLLFLRRPRDPVALLFSFAFLILAAVIDPPLRMWTAAGMGQVYDVYSTLGWALLVIGIAAFPDGKFTPPPVRWVLLAAPLAGVPLAVDAIPVLVGAGLAFVLPLFLLVCHVIKYRRIGPGIERQQVKWAAFGFGSGLSLLTASFIVFAATETPTGLSSVLAALIFLALFNFGFMAMALGLLVSLIRFRLWEADAVIGRSAVSAAVTLLVGILWTLSIDMVKMAVEWVLGEENATVATVVGGLLAAGVFAPTQALAMRWAKRRLEGDESRITRLIGRLAVWRATETPEEIGVRTLSALHAAVHCNAAAVLVDGPRGLELLASRDLERAEELGAHGYEPDKDPRFTMRLPLEDEDGPIGLLLVGPRSDLNRYNAAQLRGLGDLTEPLAEALRAALKRAQHAETVHLKLGSVEERLARLEQSGPKLRPT